MRIIKKLEKDTGLVRLGDVVIGSVFPFLGLVYLRINAARFMRKDKMNYYKNNMNIPIYAICLDNATHSLADPNALVRVVDAELHVFTE